MGDEEISRDRVELVLVSLSNMYLELDSISIGASRHSSCSTLYCLLTT